MQTYIDKKYLCHKCGFKTNFILNFKNHSCKVCKCKKCNAVFNLEDELINHTCTNNSVLKDCESEKNKSKFICLKCNFTCKSKGVLKLHNNVHFKGQFKCSYCDFVTNFDNLLKMHLKFCGQSSTQKKSSPTSLKKGVEVLGYTTWSHEDKLELYWCDTYAKSILNNKHNNNIGRLRRKMLVKRGNLDMQKLLNTSDRSLYSIIAVIRNGKASISKKDLAKIEENVCEFLQSENAGRKNDKANGSQNIKGSKAKSQNLCIYCKNYFNDLLHHMTVDHSDKKRLEIKKILLLEDVEKNVKEFVKEKNNTCKKSFDVNISKVICLECNGTFAKNILNIHQEKCKGEILFLDDIQNSISTHCNRYKYVKEELLSSFYPDVLSNLNLDINGIHTLKEPLILLIGNDEYKNLQGLGKHGLLRVLSHMRRIAELLVETNKTRGLRYEAEISFTQLFTLEYFEDFIEALHKLSLNTDNEKYSCSRLHHNSVKKALKSLFYYYQKRNETEMINKLEQFQEKFLKSAEEILSKDDSNVSLKNETQDVICDPTINCIKKLGNFVLKEFKELVKGNRYFSMLEYVRLRRAVVARIIFLNGLNPGDVRQITIQDWKYAKSDGFIDRNKIGSPVKRVEQKVILQYFKLICVKGIDLQKTILVFIPRSCYQALDILSNKVIRVLANIHPANDFLFPSSTTESHSEDSTHIFNDVAVLCKNTKFPSYITISESEKRAVSSYFEKMELPSSYQTENFMKLKKELPLIMKACLEFAPFASLTKDYFQKSKKDAETPEDIDAQIKTNEKPDLEVFSKPMLPVEMEVG